MAAIGTVWAPDTWVSSGGWETATWADGADPPATATRFYPSLQVPSVRVEGPLRNASWGVLTAFTNNWSETHWTWRLSTSKTDAGALTTESVRTNQQGNYDLNYARWMTKPLAAQTVSGTLDLCFQLAASWEPGLDPPDNSSDVRYRIYAYIAQGQSSVVRHVLCDVVDSVPFDFPNLIAQSLASPAALSSGACLEGDCVVIELGFRVVTSPTPTPSYPPTEFTHIQFRGKGVSGTDMIAGDTSLDRTPWFEFSNGLEILADPAPPANATCETAVAISTAPYTSPFIDTTQAPGTQREVWFTYTAERTGLLILTTFGANYQTDIDAFTGSCAGLTGVSSPISGNNTGIHRSQSTYLFEATSGTPYFFRVRNLTNTQNAINSGGSLRFSIQYQEVPVIDDLYLPCGNVCAFREGQIVNLTANFFGSAPSGVAIDYTETPMNDLNGGTNSTMRLLVGLHDFELVEILDIITLNNGQSEIDFIGEPWSVPLVNLHPATLFVTTAGVLYVGWFGDGYLFVAGIGTRPAVLDAVSSVPAYSAIKSIPATDGDNQPGAPFTDTEIVVGIDNIAPWAISLDEANGIIYYTDGGFYLPVGGQVIKRWSLTSGQLADFATISVGGGPNPGLKGLQFIPGGEVLVCNSSEVLRLDASGAVVQTYTPSLPVITARCIVDVKLTADGESLWVADLDSRLTKFDVATGAELFTIQPYLLPATLTQMAIFQPSGIVPPDPPVETICPGGGLPLAPGSANGNACVQC